MGNSDRKQHKLRSDVAAGRRPAFWGAVIALAFALVACGGEGPIDEVVEDFSLNVVPTERAVTAGSTVDVEVNVDRNAAFAEDVVLAVSGLPTGVTADTVTVAGDDETATVTLEAAADAAPAEDVEVTVSGTAGDESDSDTFDLDVVEATPVAEPGDPNPEFGTEGVRTNVFQATDGTVTHVHAVELLADGSMLVAGSSDAGPSLILTRVTASGDLDTDFGTGTGDEDGMTTTDIFGTVDALDLMVDEANDVVRVAAVTEATDGSHSFDLVEFTYGDTTDVDGTPTGTGSTVSIQTQIDAVDDTEFLEAHDVDFVLEGPAAGTILVAGAVDEAIADGASDFGILRFAADGTLDTTFSDSDGVESASMGSGDDVAYGVEVLLEEDNYDLILFGASNTDPDGIGVATVIRVLEGGNVVVDGFGPMNDRLDLGFGAVYDAVVLSNGDIVAGGVAEGATAADEDDVALARFDPEGLVNADFGTTGEVSYHLAGAEAITELALEGDTVVAAGTSQVAGEAQQIFVARYAAATGAQDADFGDAGHVLTNFTGATAEVDALATDGEDIVVGGSSGDEATLAVFTY